MTALFAVLFLFAALYGLRQRGRRKDQVKECLRVTRIADEQLVEGVELRSRALKAERRADDAERRLAELSRSVVPSDEEINRWLESAGR